MRMTTSDDAHPAVREGTENRDDRGAPLTGATDHRPDQDPGDTPGNAADAEREQERQLAEGTESPG